MLLINTDVDIFAKQSAVAAPEALNFPLSTCRSAAPRLTCLNSNIYFYFRSRNDSVLSFAVPKFALLWLWRLFAQVDGKMEDLIRRWLGFVSLKRKNGGVLELNVCDNAFLAHAWEGFIRELFRRIVRICRRVFGRGVDIFRLLYF